jgi:cytochrome P450 family 142 subfamily A polypeptide 1
MSTAPFSLIDPEWWRTDPQDDYRWMREQPGLWRCPDSGFFAVTRHEELMAVERDAKTFASDKHYRVVPGPEELTMISQDDPGHLDQRRMINRRFTPKAVRSHGDHYRNMIRGLADDAVQVCSDTGSVEVVDALAAQLPCRVTGELLGFGSERWREVKSWSERQMRIDRRMVDPVAEHDLVMSIFEWAAVMQELLPQRAAVPQEDLFSDWLAAGMAPEVMVQETGLMIAGGAETTRTVIAHGLHAFCEHPEQWEMMHDEPALIPTAVEELIRWVTPLNNMFRIATVDTEVGGQHISAGDRLALVYPAANRDPAVFDEPDRFDISRSPNPHVSFGYGTHFCLGANLARLEVRLLLEELVPRITALRAVSEPVVEPNIFARAVVSFDMGWELR